MPLAPRTFDAPRRPRLFYATEIAEPVRVDPSNPKWIQLCAVGSYVYRGEPIAITAATFDQMVANFRRHPAYDATARALSGKPTAEVAPLVTGGKFGVVALNFDHPPMGAPRPGHGWFMDLERRGGELWGLVFFDAEAHAGMVAAAWKWTSIEWTSDTAAPTTGANIGAYLSGVALTNDPFIQGMTPIQQGRGFSFSMAFGAATDVLCELRGILALPETSDVGAVIGEIAKLRAWALGEQPAPLGVEVGPIVARVRGLLNLPTLTDAASIFAELGKLLGALAAEPTPETSPMPDPIPPVIAAARPSEIAKRLAARFKIDVADEPALVIAFEREMGRFDDAMSHYNGLKTVLGAKSAEDMTDKLTKLQALDAQMAELLPELQAAEENEEKAEGEMVANDVGAVMAAMRLDPRQHPGVFEGLAMARRGDPSSFKFATDAQGSAVFGKDGTRTKSTPKERREKRLAAREKFLAQHGMSTRAPQGRYQGAVSPAMFAGAGAAYAPVGQPQSQAPQTFGAQHGAPFVPAPPNGWSMARVHTLPAAPEGDNVPQRIFNEIVRTEFGGKANGHDYDRAWARVMQIQTEIAKQA